jgi:curved DNA-binding protein CbpA
LAKEYALLQVAPGADLATVDAAYEARLEETRPERFPEGSPERAGAQRRKAAIEAAYERVRDALNTTETRFEKLEF